MPSYTLDRLILGEAAEETGLNCVAPLVPCKATLTNTTSRVPATLYFCADPSIDPCATGGTLQVLDQAGYTLEDDPCA